MSNWGYDDTSKTWVPPPQIGAHSHGVEDLTSTSSISPIGMLAPYVGSTAPSGWLICDGTTFSASTYPALATLLGGTTLPNLKGRVVVGVDASQAEFDTVGETGGAKTHTLTEAQMPVHNHNVGARDTSDGAGGAQNGVWTRQAVYDSSAVIRAAGSGAAHPILQPYIAYNYIIRAA